MGRGASRIAAAAMATVHIVGAGMAGLAAAVRLARRGRRVVLYDRAPMAGGRCRSYYDTALDRLIDNGNHLLLSANRAALAFMRDSGGQGRLRGSGSARFAFTDLADGTSFAVRPNAGPLPWWIWASGRRIPGTQPSDYLSGLAFLRARGQATVADIVGNEDPLFRPFWEPLTLAVLNTTPDRAAASLLAAVLRRTFAWGEQRCRPLIAERGLGPDLVDPAVGYLIASGAEVAFGRRLRRIGRDGGRAVSLDFGDGEVALKASDSVVLAVPPSAAGELLPELQVPEDGDTILNAHFRVDGPLPHDDGPILGLLGSTAQWVFSRGDVISVTVSAAGDLADRPASELAETLWADVAKAMRLGARPLPAHRIIKERRATFAQTPENLLRRPGTRTRLDNLMLAGDWTDTGLPATIEGAVTSGQRAASALLRRRHG